MRAFLVALLACAAAARLAAQEPPKAPVDTFRVEVGVFTLQADGSVGGRAVEYAENAGQEFVSGIVTDGCRLGAGQGYVTSVPTWGRDAWQVRGRVSALAPDQAVIELEWKRIRAGGVPVQHPAESKQLVLPLGQLNRLDIPTFDSADSCASRPVVFGARYAPRPEGGSGRAGSGTGSGGGFLVPAFDAELWLVRSLPGQPDTVLPATARIVGGVGNFRFGPTQVSVPAGVFEVHIEGQLMLTGTDPQSQIVFKATRAAAFIPAARPVRDRATPDPEGVAFVRRPMPGPDDVLEFQMPPLELRGAPSVPDTFAVRVRIKPVKGR